MFRLNASVFVKHFTLMKNEDSVETLARFSDLTVGIRELSYQFIQE